VHAAEIARGADRRVSLTLSDEFCVERHRESFKHLVAGHVDILFANEREILSLYESKDLSGALQRARAACPLVVVTRSERGSLIASNGETIELNAMPTKVVDTTGAGDQFAAGFLFAHARGRSLKESGALASLAAAEVISHMGPRPEANLRALALQNGFRV
jgi:sugar/nucleoside kinase (ribokinase family)